MKKNLILLLLFFLSLLLYITDVSSSRYVKPVTQVFFVLLLSLYKAKGNLQEYLQEKIQTYIFLVDVQKKNLELSKKLEELNVYKAMYTSCEASLIRLSNDLGLRYTPTGKYQVINAKIIGYDLKGKDEYILINKGRDENLKEGFLVFSNQNLVGVVEKVLPMSSVVLTVYSDRFSLSSTTLDYTKNYIYKGGWKEGQLLHVSYEDEINTGSYVVIRGVERELPAFFIGRISRVESIRGDFFKKVYVKPVVDVRKLEYVSILKSEP